VVVAGYTVNGSIFDIAVARLTNAGSLDASFDGDGKTTIIFGSSNQFAYGVAVDNLDRVIVAGGAVFGSTQDIAVARLTVAGTLDPSFDGDGRATIAFGSSNQAARAVTIDSQGRIVVAGFAVIGSNLNFALARLSTSGALDLSFD
jgi:uncharacterized delta-60 repeat protein